MICEKCNTEMTYFKNGQSQGWTCPNCGNGLVTSRFDDMQLDSNIYVVVLQPNENLTTSALKIVSKISGLNILDSRKLATNGGEVIKGKANKIFDAVKQLNGSGLLYNISPNYPYDI